MWLNCAGKKLSLSKPAVMGVLNITPDSFSDGGKYFTLDAALRQAQRMFSEGAAIIDVGGESTRPARPGAGVPSIQQEIDRVMPILERLLAELPIPLSIDTSKAELITEAVRMGVGMINDTRALTTPGALSAAAASTVPVCLMHMRGQPQDMQDDPYYVDVVGEVSAFLMERVRVCEAAGIGRERILVDPGFCFGKNLQHNLTLLSHIGSFTKIAAGVMVGISRKSMLGLLLNTAVNERLAGSLAAAVLAAWQGACLIRAHDVLETVQALRVCRAVLGSADLA